MGEAADVFSPESPLPRVVRPWTPDGGQVVVGGTPALPPRLGRDQEMCRGAVLGAEGETYRKVDRVLGGDERIAPDPQMPIRTPCAA